MRKVRGTGAFAVCMAVLGGCSSGGEERAPLATESSSSELASGAGWCAHVAGGAASTKSTILSLSAMHAANRAFGAHTSTVTVDHALAVALSRARIDERTLRDYVAAIPEAEQCVQSASSATLAPAHVSLVGDVALIRPGTGALTLPAGARAVAIDVRGLPSVPRDLLASDGVHPSDPVRAAIDAAVALALAAPVRRPLLNLRASDGLVNEDAQWGDVGFEPFTTQFEDEDFPGGAAVDLPLAVITGPTLAPAAAELAIAMRLAGRAWLLGADAYAGVAESAWSPVDAHGLAWREFDASDPVTSARWPDLVPADARGSDVAALVAGLSSRGAPPTITPGPATRTPIAVYPNPYEPASTTLGAGEARAALFVAHGALRRFDFQFGDVGDVIDDRLAESLLEAELVIRGAGHGAIDRAAYEDVLRRFGQAARDGHNFVTDEARPFTGFLPLKLEQIDGKPVVRRSEVEGIVPGDTILAIDGVPQEVWYAGQLAITSASTDSYRWNQVTRKRLLRVYGARSFIVKSAGGHVMQVTAQPKPFAYEGVFGSSPIARSSGFLADLGAPNVFFLNMSFEFSPTPEDAVAAIASATSAEAIIVDMRGYPHGNHYLVDATLLPDGFLSPWFRDGFVFSPNPTDVFFSEGTFPISGFAPQLYTGPIVLLVGTDSASAAENFAMMLVDNHRTLHVVGRTTAGTNGTITGLELPGHYGFDFTGQNLRHSDGSRFIGIGIVPDVEVIATPQELAAGKDPELAAALHTLGH